MTSEFDIISRFFKRDMTEHDTVVFGVGDDGAILKPTVGTELVVTLDTMVENIHFPSDADPYDVGYKLMAVNLSDLAAMGAEPRWATLALTLPEIDEDWLGSFADGLYFMTDEYRVALVGGDTTHGPLTVSLQLAGEVPTGSALRRSGAQPGDNIYVSGTLGDAGFALRHRQQRVDLSDYDEAFIEQRLCRPEPRVDLGIALRAIANSAIDISDGLLADLGHILEASKVGAEIHLQQLPLSEVVAAQIKQQWDIPLASGDDYELCFTASASDHEKVMRAADQADVCVTLIGQITAESGLRCLDEHGVEYTSQQSGYDHFAEE